MDSRNIKTHASSSTSLVATHLCEILRVSESFLEGASEDDRNRRLHAPGEISYSENLVGSAVDGSKEASAGYRRHSALAYCRFEREGAAGTLLRGERRMGKETTYSNSCWLIGGNLLPSPGDELSIFAEADFVFVGDLGEGVEWLLGDREIRSPVERSE